jgi:hypothetical protein
MALFGILVPEALEEGEEVRTGWCGWGGSGERGKRKSIPFDSSDSTERGWSLKLCGAR